MRALAAAALVAVASCNDSTGPGSVVGTYTLLTVDAEPVPALLYADEFETEEMYSGEVHLNSDGSFVDLTAIRRSVNGEVYFEYLEAQGTYTVAGDVVTFHLIPAGSYQMTVDGNRLVQDWNGLELVYEK